MPLDTTSIHKLVRLQISLYRKIKTADDPADMIRLKQRIKQVVFQKRLEILADNYSVSTHLQLSGH